VAGIRFAFRIHSAVSAFHDHFSGYPARMPDSDEVPIADAVEQHRETTEQVPDEEAQAGPPADAPLEAPDADWQEQLEEVVDDPEEAAPEERTDE
jgi:hypothetical protein